jgi:hypothetical protein
MSGSEGYHVPDRILTITDDVVKRYDIRIRKVDMNNYHEEVQTVIDLSNRSLIDNWGYTLVIKAEA